MSALYVSARGDELTQPSLFTCGEAEQVLQSPDLIPSNFTVAYLNLLLRLLSTSLKRSKVPK